LVTANLPLLPRRLQLPVALRVDLLLPPRQHVFRRDIARGAVESDVVVAVHVTLHQTTRVNDRQRRSRDALGFERFVPALDLPVRLRVNREVRTCVMREFRMNSLKSLAMNWGPLSDI
jgi:hypothetical protein